MEKQKKVQFNVRTSPSTIQMFESLLDHFSNDIQKADRGKILEKCIADAYQLYVVQHNE